MGQPDSWTSLQKGRLCRAKPDSTFGATAVSSLTGRMKRKKGRRSVATEIRRARGRRCTSTAPIFACVERGFARFPTANGFIDDIVAESVAERPHEIRDFGHRMGGRLADAGIHLNSLAVG
jgi:hypothetical protein